MLGHKKCQFTLVVQVWTLAGKVMPSLLNGTAGA